MQSSVQLSAQLSNQLAKLDNKMKVPLAGAVGIAAMCAFYKLLLNWRQRQLPPASLAYGELVFEKLTIQEAGQMLIGPAITTMTFFRGDPAIAAKALRARLGDIIKKNPWLACRLVRKREADAKDLFMAYRAKVNDEDPCRFGEASLFNPTKRCGKEPKKKIEVHSRMSMTELCVAVGDTAAEIPGGSQCIGEDKQQPQMAVTVVPDAQRPTDTFCVIFSLSHVIADGFTYYKVLAMLSSFKDIESLSATRKHDIEDKSKTAIGPQEYGFMHSKAVVANVVSGIILPRKKPLIASYYIDSIQIKEAKKQIGSDVGFVSTNDVLVSAIAKAFGSRFFLMPINFRDRLPGYTATDAGNYEGALVFCPEDYASPAFIRQTLTSGPPTFRRQGNANLPGSWEAFRSHFGMLTNWTFPVFEDVKIDGCVQMLHMPMANVNMVPFDLAVLYRPRAGQLAVAFFARSIDSAGIENKCFVGGKVTCAEDAVTF